MSARDGYRRGCVALGALVGCGLLVLLARSEEEELGRLLAAYAVAAGVTGLLLCLTVPIGLVSAMRGTAGGEALLRHFKGDALLLVASVVLQCLVGLAAYPLTFRAGESHDPSWLGAVAAISGLVGGGCLLLGYVVGLMVAKPLQLLATSVGGAWGGDRRARQRTLFGLLFLLVVAMGISLTLAGTPTPHGTRDVVALFVALFGLTEVQSQAWLWCGRLLAVAIAVDLFLLARLLRSSRPPPG